MEIKQLTFTRFLAAFTIIIFHYGQAAFPFDSGLLHHFAQEGSSAVSYFFCLSGYILAHVYYREDASPLHKKQFFIKRIARIYPLYLLGFLAALVLGILFFHAVPKGGSIILQLIGLQAWIPGICLEINFPAWSLSVELFFYLCFPFLLQFFERASTKKIIGFTIVTWIISAASHILLKSADGLQSMKGSEFILYNPLFHLNVFIFGMAAAIFVKRKQFSMSNAASNALFLVTSALVFITVSTDNFILPWTHNGLLAPLFVLLIISLQLNKKGIASLFGLKPLVFLGNISYAMYILQHPVREVFGMALKHPGFEPSDAFIFYFYLITLILISALAFLYIEKPVRNKITNLISIHP